MADGRKNDPGPGGPLDHILEEHKRKEKSYGKESCITGSDSKNLDDRPFKVQRIVKIISILSSWSLILGLLIFLFLWLSR